MKGQFSSSGGSHGVRDIKALKSSVNQPRLTFDQKDFYPGIVPKAAALCFFLIMNHAFIDGNKRVGHIGLFSKLPRPYKLFKLKYVIETTRIGPVSVTSARAMPWQKT
jgi:hypothetical protein